MNDWSDTGECHDNDGIHRSSGRIYRIVYDGPDKGAPTTRRPEWLTKRESESFDPSSYLSSNDESQRALAIRWFAEDKGSAEPALASNSTPLVRLELAAALQRIPLESRFPLATSLSTHSEDATDRQQSLMIWYGIAEAVSKHPDKAVKLALSSKLPTVTRLITRRLAEDLEKTPAPVNDLLSCATDENRLPILRGLNEGLKGWASAPKPSAWDSINKAGTDEETQTIIRELSLVFGEGRARDELLAIAASAEADPGARRAALTNLLRDPAPELLPKLKEWTNDRVLAREAILGLANYDDADVPSRVLNQWKRDTVHRAVVIDVLVSRASFAGVLLKRIAAGEIPRDAISPFHARQIHSLGDEALTKQLAEVWGEVRDTPGALKAEIVNWKTLLTPAVIAAADPAEGKTTYAALCAACHKLYGEGGAIGPDLTGSDRHNLDYLLGNIVNPNEIVPADYRLTVFTLRDGRVVSGVIPEENERTVTVQTPVERLVIPADTITKRESLPVSLMPEGLLQTMDEAAVKDLIAYLMTKAPVEAK